MRKSSGVTLTELMVTVVIIGIMASLAIPGFGRFLGSSKIKHQTDKMVGDIYRSRAKAIEQGASWHVVFSPAQESYYAFSDRNANGELDEGEERQGPYKLDKGIAFGSFAPLGPNNTLIPEDGVSFQDNHIAFNRMGSCNAGTVYLKSKDTSAAVRVLPASGTTLAWIYKGGWVER